MRRTPFLHWMKSLLTPVTSGVRWLDEDILPETATNHDLLTENLRLAGELDEQHELSRTLLSEIEVLRHRVVDDAAKLREAVALGIKACDIADDQGQKYQVAHEANLALTNVLALRDADIVYLKGLLAKPSAPPKCKKHPTYQAKRKPRVACAACAKLYRFAQKRGEFAVHPLSPLTLTPPATVLAETRASMKGAK